MICAACGEDRELCRSVRSDGIQQPRICKPCFLDFMDTGVDKTNGVFWFLQLQQDGDQESIDNIKAKT